MRIALLLLTLVLAACLPVEGTDTTSTDLKAGTFDPDLATRSQAACEAEGGRWGTGSLAGANVCYRETPDANQPCSSQNDCTGLCFARSRTCSPITPIFGCHDILTSLGGTARLCID